MGNNSKYDTLCLQKHLNDKCVNNNIVYQRRFGNEQSCPRTSVDICLSGEYKEPYDINNRFLSYPDALDYLV